MHKNLDKTFPKRHLAIFMLSYCLFPCVPLTEARDRSIEGKPWMPSSVILLPLISEHIRSPIHSRPADWALHTAPSQWNLDETALKCEAPSSQSRHWTNVRASLTTSLHQAASAALPVWHQLRSLPGRMRSLHWLLTRGTVLQRSHHFPCANPILALGLSPQTPAESRRAFLTKVPT